MPPCDQIRVTQTTSEMQDTDLDIFQRALEKAGFDVGRSGGALYFSGPCFGQYFDGKLVCDEGWNEFLRKLYSEQVVIEMSEKMGWNLMKESDSKFIASKPYSDDKVNFEILADGTIKTITDMISAANHSNAEQFLLYIQNAIGGKTVITHKHGEGEAHSHEFGHQH